MDQNITNYLSEHFRWRYFHFPVYPNNGLKYLDLTVGLTMVAIAEEFVYAGIHWGSGLTGVVNSIVWAIPITWYYLKYKDIRPCVIAHYMTDLFVFLKA